MEIEIGILQDKTIRKQAALYLQVTGLFLLRYGLALMVLLFGLQKWTKAEAEAIQPWVSHSPLMSWLYHVTSVQGASIAIGAVELAIAAMIFARRWLPVIASVGSGMGIVMFLITISFLVTTPKIDPGSVPFLMKDIFLLGVAIWSTGESLTGLAPSIDRNVCHELSPSLTQQ
ncbi:DUF417 family protein [Acidobacteria bacterium AB60]|nr:DUF417 family protein [Acidobacteria bacterium AB60]